MSINTWPDSIDTFCVVAGDYEKDVNTVNPLGMKGQLATAFAQLINALWSGTHQSFAPTKIKVSYCFLCVILSLYQQKPNVCGALLHLVSLLLKLQY